MELIPSTGIELTADSKNPQVSSAFDKDQQEAINQVTNSRLFESKESSEDSFYIDNGEDGLIRRYPIATRSKDGQFTLVVYEKECANKIKMITNGYEWEYTPINVCYKIFDKDGKAVYDKEFCIQGQDECSNSRRLPNIVPLSDGFLALYMQYTSETMYDVYAQKIDFEGNQIGNITRINHDCHLEGHQDNPIGIEIVGENILTAYSTEDDKLLHLQIFKQGQEESADANSPFLKKLREKTISYEKIYMFIKNPRFSITKSGQVVVKFEITNGNYPNGKTQGIIRSIGTDSLEIGEDIYVNNGSFNISSFDIIPSQDNNLTVISAIKSDQNCTIVAEEINLTTGNSTFQFSEEVGDELDSFNGNIKLIQSGNSTLIKYAIQDPRMLVSQPFPPVHTSTTNFVRKLLPQRMSRYPQVIEDSTSSSYMDIAPIDEGFMLVSNCNNTNVCGRMYDLNFNEIVSEQGQNLETVLQTQESFTGSPSVSESNISSSILYTQSQSGTGNSIPSESSTGMATETKIEEQNTGNGNTGITSGSWSETGSEAQLETKESVSATSNPSMTRSSGQSLTGNMSITKTTTNTQSTTSVETPSATELLLTTIDTGIDTSSASAVPFTPSPSKTSISTSSTANTNTRNEEGRESGNNNALIIGGIAVTSAIGIGIAAKLLCCKKRSDKPRPSKSGMEMLRDLPV